MENMKVSARAAAYRSLMLCERDGKYSNLEIDSAIKRFSLDGAERGLFCALVYGVIERRITLDYIIGRLSARPVESLDAEVRTLLRMGLYQLIYMDRIPESAAVNETVALSKRNAPRAAAFINAVLRGFLRTYGKNSLPYPDRLDMTEYLSVRYSCSPDVVKIFTSCFNDAEAVLSAFETQPDITLRVNTLRHQREEIIAKLNGEEISAEPTRYSPFGIRLTGKSLNQRISELISQGSVYIQDEASQIAVLAADPKPDTVVLDTCSCPGGKSFGAAMLMKNRGEIRSFDLHKNKLSLVEKGAKRLGIDIITTSEKNGSVFSKELVECADTVICDVPCSGLGVIAKKPEIRYKTAEEISRLPEIQYAILSNVSKYVKRGGVLCYSTCTLNRSENDEVVHKFMSMTDEFEMCDFSVSSLSSNKGMLVMSPDLHKTDGFFVAKMKRK